MAKDALIVSRTMHNLGSCFGWTDTLQGIDITGYPAIIFHDSKDDEATTLAHLVTAFKTSSKVTNKADKTKFLYISAELSPLLVMFFHGIQGDVYDNEVALSDSDLLYSLLDDYNDSPIALKPAQEEFSELRKAMDRLLDGELDEEEMYAIINSEDWKSQVKASMDTMSTSLVRISTTNRALVKYVNTTRVTLEAMQQQINTAEAQLAQAMSAADALASKVENGNQTNVITKFPAVQAPLAANKLLYIKEYSHCNYLISFILAYSHYLSTMKGIRTRLLVVVPKTQANMKLYSPEVFYNLSVDSLSSSDLQRHSVFVTNEPKKNIMDAFFGSTNVDFYVVIDRLQDNLFLKSLKMKTLYAVGSERARSAYGLDPKTVIRSVEGAPESIVIPYLKDYTAAQTATVRRNLYFQSCKSYFERFDKLFEFN